MVAADSGGGGALQAANQVRITIEAIEKIAKDTMSQLEDNATRSSQDFRNLDLPADSFGEVPLARTLATQHQAAHSVFVETIQGVLEDLRQFGDSLLASAEAHRHTDDAVYATLVALGRDYRDHEYRAEENWRDARVQQGEQLKGADGADVPAGAGATDGGTAETASDTGSESGAGTGTQAAPAALQPGDPGFVGPVAPDGTGFDAGGATPLFSPDSPYSFSSLNDLPTGGADGAGTTPESAGDRTGF